jgi:rod shape determining protein RodA
MINRKCLEHFDWILMLSILVLSGFGILTIYSVTYDDPGFSDYEKQLVWFACGLVVMTVTALPDYRHWLKLAPVFYGFTTVLLIFILFTKPVLGVRRWIDFLGLIRVQPSELAKISLIMMLAYWLAKLRGNEPKFKDLIVPTILTGIPFVLILLEPDLGTSLILGPLFVILIFVSGYNIRIMAGIAIVTITIAGFTAPHILKPYQMNRIVSFLNPEADPLGSGYHLIQSKIAIGSGGYLGKGFKGGTQSYLDFLPVQDTDFIFSVWGEEHGFVGAVGLLILYLVVLMRILKCARQSRDVAGSYLCVGFAVMLCFQIFINIGMVIGLMPITGLPLPFMSYGGSACLINFFAIGLVLNVGMRKYPDYNV